MRYADKQNLFFAHIPKCAGRSVIKALGASTRYPFAEMAADTGLTVEEAEARFVHTGYDHPALGPIDPFHLPLPVLSEHFPRTYGLVSNATAFAILREPRARFISALTQRMREHLGYSNLRLEDPAVQTEAEAVCEWLRGRAVFADVTYVHFTRQADYVEEGGRRIVRHLFSIDDMGGLESWLGSQGLDVEIEYGFDRRQPKKWFRALHPIASGASRLLPTAVRRAIYPYWVNSGVFARAVSEYDQLQFSDGVERFIRDYYAKDAELYRSVAGGG